MFFDPIPDDGDKTFSFPRQCHLLKINGVWPILEDTSLSIQSYLYLIWSAIIIILVALTCYAQSAFVFHAWGDILTVTECGCTVLMGLHNLMRLIHLFIHRNDLKEIMLNFVQNIWISKKLEKSIAEQCEKNMFILKIMSSMLFVLIWMYVLLPLIELINPIDPDVKPFPYKMIFPYDANHGWQYPVTYILTSLAGFAVVTTFFAQDSLFAFFVSYTCGQFDILHNKIERIVHTDIKLSNGNQPISILVKPKNYQLEYNRSLIEVIKHHNKIISFSNQLEYLFSPLILINYMISSFLICLTGFQIAAVKMTLGNLAKLVVYVVSCLCQLFILCWKGDKLIESSEITAWKLYACNWERTLLYTTNLSNPLIIKTINSAEDVKFIKHLTFAIQRSQKALCITAYKFSVLSLKSFSAILSTSLSYFALLQTLVEKSE